MGKRSTKKDKNIYQLSREARALTREAAGEELVFLSPERIEKIESGRSAPHPDEVLAMERCYRNPELSNWFCTHECPIGMKYEQEVKLKSLAQVTVETLAALHAMEQEKDRLVEISVDGRVNDFERKDFDRILEKLKSIDRAIRSMQIWLEHALQTGKIDEAGE
ncbi:MAG: helix-turn-helix domain-containing protein [Oscillospiraceae bacterium]|nr:helix-turn-helix domain-containing protein [Oscillospiraceae bacterium]